MGLEFNSESVFGKGLISYCKGKPSLAFRCIGKFNLISVYYWQRREEACFTSLLIEVPILACRPPKARDSWCLCELVRCEGEKCYNN